MSEHGSTKKENVLILPGKENSRTRSRASPKEKAFDLTEQSLIEKSDESTDFDADSGVCSIHQTRNGKSSPTSPSAGPLEDDFDVDHLTRAMSSSSTNTKYDSDRRISDVTSTTDFTTNRTVSDYFPDSRKTSQTSASVGASSIGLDNLSTRPKPSSQSTGSEQKSKSGVKYLFRKIFRGVPRAESIPQPIPIETPPTQGKSPEIPSVRRSQLCITQGPIRLLVLRHGERLDRYYSSQWLRQAFDKDGNYCRFSPILPETLPFRASIRDFDLDPPLTYKGLKDAFHTGTVLREKNIQINYCYSSPSLRCVQTASKILEGLQLQNKMKIRLEPGLFECTGWYTISETNSTLMMPRFLTKREFVDNKYAIDRHYREQMTYKEISQVETELEFYQRSHAVTASIMNMHENEFVSQIQQGQATPQQNLHILFIAHAPSLETCTRKLCGGKFRPETLAHVIRNVDFLTMTVIEKTDNNSDKWIFRRSSFYGDEF